MVYIIKHIKIINYLKSYTNEFLLSNSKYNSFISTVYFFLDTRLSTNKIFMIIFFIIYFKFLFFVNKYKIRSIKKKIKSRRRNYRNINIKFYVPKNEIVSYITFIFDSLIYFNFTDYILLFNNKYFYRNLKIKKLYINAKSFGFSNNQWSMLCKSIIKDDLLVKNIFFFYTEMHYFKIYLNSDINDLNSNLFI